MLVTLFYIVVIPSSVLAAFVFWRKHANPEKSLFNAFISVAVGPMRWLKLGPYKQGTVDLDKALTYATKKAKLNDFGDMTFYDNYKAILNTDFQKAQVYSNLGFIMARVEMNMTMVRRLKVVNYLKMIPAVKQVPVRTPVFVLGLPRTGTTYLHRLLSLDPAVRAPLLWELMASVPGPTTEYVGHEAEYKADADKRANYVRKLIKTQKSIGDGALKHIHEIDPDLPEECLMALPDELPLLLQLLYSAYLDYKVFLKNITPDKLVKGYLWYKDILRILSYQVGEAENPHRWLLKCPFHLFAIPELAAAFPDAKIIWYVHRVIPRYVYLLH